MRGKAMVGSAKVRSVNQYKPPVFMDSTGALVMPRRPKNMDVKNMAWVMTGNKVLYG